MTGNTFGCLLQQWTSIQIPKKVVLETQDRHTQLAFLASPTQRAPPLTSCLSPSPPATSQTTTFDPTPTAREGREGDAVRRLLLLRECCRKSGRAERIGRESERLSGAKRRTFARELTCSLCLAHAAAVTGPPRAPPGLNLAISWLVGPSHIFTSPSAPQTARQDASWLKGHKSLPRTSIVSSSSQLCGPDFCACLGAEFKFKLPSVK